jgi:hypothetical protein
MDILDTTSLVITLDHINDELLNGEAIPSAVGMAAARWIASRQGGKGSYRGMFAPTQADFEQGIHVFTGEKLASASARHIMGEEAARAVWLLGRDDPDVKAAYDRAIVWMQEASPAYQEGTYCCGRCTLAFWRHYWVGDFANKEALIGRGLQALREYRIGDGKWRRYPFYYTIYALLSLELDSAREELRYAQPVMERLVRMSRTGGYSQRRQAILEKALERL